MKYRGIYPFLLFTILSTLIALSGCTSAPEPEPVPVEEPAPEPEPMPEEPQPVEEEEEFVVTQEIYEQTFVDVEALIEELNAIIQSEDFSAWREYLTDEYVAYYSDPAVLKGISDELKKKYRYELRLRTLQDYFLYIVVGSRQEADLEEIEFIDENHLLAYSIVNETPAILYYLANEDGDWKIAKWQ